MKLTFEIFLGVLAAKFVYDFIVLAIIVEGVRKLFKPKAKTTTAAPSEPAPNTNL